jgi:hypothetical protein
MMPKKCFELLVNVLWVEAIKLNSGQIPGLMGEVQPILLPINVQRLPGHARGLRGANESGSSNQSPTVTFQFHFSLQPSDTVIFIVLRAYLKEND